jgi:hypothetical protein
VRRTLRLAAPLILAVLGAAVPTLPATAKKQVAFPDGVWTGTAIYTGSAAGQGFLAEADADVEFELTVNQGDVTDGTMAVKGSGSGSGFSVGGGAGVLDFSGKLTLSGNAALVLAQGSVSFSGIVSGVPVEFGGGTSFEFAPSFVTCNRVTGDLTGETQGPQGTTASAKFVAIRTGAPGAAKSVLQEYDELVDAVVDALSAIPLDINEMLALIQRIDQLNAQILGLGQCQGPLPPGFSKGLSDTLLTALFQDLIKENVLDHADKYTAQALLSILGVGVRIGAVGNAVPGSAPLKLEAKNLLALFDIALEQKLDEAIAAGDSQTILDILVGAQQYGLDALADKAQGALAQVQP